MHRYPISTLHRPAIYTKNSDNSHHHICPFQTPSPLSPTTTQTQTLIPHSANSQGLITHLSHTPPTLRPNPNNYIPHTPHHHLSFFTMHSQHTRHPHWTHHPYCAYHPHTPLHQHTPLPQAQSQSSLPHSSEKCKLRTHTQIVIVSSRV